ncbi:GAF domain-containing protein [Streptomyces sp. Isolate_45]|uniref:GAF domain-containing protein n=1 Tax=Streptomyces sp. Isolate_45 TaxID=2950111 RepID=UPI002481B443|nr:GAF domain-containing protein [Streptomyces sp. Isolate_45]MDA5286209.1 GAF domain-containing protein [Streptomyces sp. Isolate_45]
MAAAGLLDTPPEGTFDDLAQLALSITGAQKAFFTVADGRRAFWRSSVGTDPAAGRENDIRGSPCHILIGTGRELIAEVARTHLRIKDLAVVGALGIGAWAGYPVVSPEGRVLGGFCVVDQDARPFTPGQRQALQTLARYTVRAEAGRHTHPSVILHRLHQAMANQRVSGRFLPAALTTFCPADGMGLLGGYAGA